MAEPQTEMVQKQHEEDVRLHDGRDMPGRCRSNAIEELIGNTVTWNFISSQLVREHQPERRLRPEMDRSPWTAGLAGLPEQGATKEEGGRHIRSLHESRVTSWLCGLVGRCIRSEGGGTSSGVFTS